ncbi:hypothetical protein J6590_017580 [Homalodisca vitripennis]|nr:hypothetical protein J6590_017580 [Homalodisca vitripennis]
MLVYSNIIDEPIDFHLDVHRISIKRVNGPKPIVLQFTNKQKRDRFLQKSKAASKRQEIKSMDIIAGVFKTNVYVNEHLTHFFKNLFCQSKRLREIGFKFVWLSEGKIYVLI